MVTLTPVGEIDRSRPRIENPDGSFSTERTITIEADGRHFLIPTIVGGKDVGEEQAIKLWEQGKNKEVGAFGSAPEAQAAAEARTDEIGKVRGGEKPALTFTPIEEPSINLTPVEDEERVATFLPLARNVQTGDFRLAVPGILQNLFDGFVSAVTLPGDVAAGRVDPASDEAIARSVDLGAVATGVGATARMGATGARGAVRQGAEEITPEIHAGQQAMNAVRTADEVPANIPDFAGNINLNRIYAPEDVKEAIRQTAKENGEFFAARRGVVSQNETREMAQLLGMTEANLAKRNLGQAFNAEEMLAARSLLVSQATKVRDMARRGSGGADVDKAQFAEELTRLVSIQEQVAGATAEAGRTLAQFRMMAGASKDEIAAIVKAAEAGGMDDIMRKVADLDDPAKVAQFARGAYKAKASDMILEAWINALLSGPSTHVVNILSNTLTAAWAIPERAAAATISKLTGSGIAYRESIGKAFGFLEGAKDGIRAGWRAFRTEEPSDAASKLDVRKYQAIPNVKVGGVEIGGKQVRLPGRLLLASDEFFKAIGYRQEINALAIRQGLKEGLKGKALAERVSTLRSNPTEPMMKAGRENAAKQTFTNPLGKAGQGVMALTREIPALRIVMPFIRTPVNIVKFAADRSPFAPLFKEVRENLKGANGPEARDSQIARIGLGSTVSAVAAYMAAEGVITGGGPSDGRERGLKYADGWQPYSVKIGDTYYSYSRLEPMGMLLGVASDFAELKDALTAEEEANVAALIMGSVSKNLISKTWLQGPSDLIEAIQDPERYGARYVQRLVGTAIPTGIAQVARAQDPYLREARTLLESIKARVPGYRETLFLRRDVFGQPVKLEGGLGPDVASPIYHSTAKNDPVIAEMLRLSVIPGSLPRTIRNVELEPVEYDAYSEAAGTLMKAGLNTVVGLPQWSEFPDHIKSELMSDVIRKSRDLARAQTIFRHPAIALRIVEAKRKEQAQ